MHRQQANKHKAGQNKPDRQSKREASKARIRQEIWEERHILRIAQQSRNGRGTVKTHKSEQSSSKKQKTDQGKVSQPTSFDSEGQEVV